MSNYGEEGLNLGAQTYSWNCKMKSLILSIIFFLLVTLAVVDSIVWHHNDDKKVACTVVFKAEPTVSRTGRPYYYFEVRRNDNNEWHQISVSGETYSTIGKGDQLVADFNNDVPMVLHVAIIVFGVFFGGGFFTDYVTSRNKRPNENQA